jgi:diaminohydroxyphosphoribosylaminopyrimidine deaminase/5-amino-6-(5-phosphoribosylamino)uracil reductase
VVDERLMQRALELARNALYTATPNPRVGCVIARGDRVIGEGWTQPYGGPHAEQHALLNCTEDPAGATAFVTLEPCNHVGPSGRSGSCVESVVRARVARVVVAVLDPSPAMRGKSLQMLQSRGIATAGASGECADQARELNLGFFSRIQRGRPWVRVKMAASLDGRTALASGESQWITGAAARADGHAWRARACAVMTGIGTLLQDDPQLTVRDVSTPRQPQRIVVDRHARTPAAARILHGDRVWIVTARAAMADFPTNAEEIRMPDADGRVDLEAMMLEFGRRRINELHVEAGARLAGALIEHRLVDELLLYYAPCLLGNSAREMFTFGPLDRLAARVNLEVKEWARIGDDMRVIARMSPTPAWNPARTAL